MQRFWPFPVRTGMLTGTSVHPLDGLHVPDYCVFCSYVLHTAHHEINMRWTSVRCNFSGCAGLNPNLDGSELCHVRCTKDWSFRRSIQRKLKRGLLCYGYRSERTKRSTDSDENPNEGD